MSTEPRAWGADPAHVENLKGGFKHSDIVGEHTILFSTAGESIELTHRARTRDIFARGALLAAGFVAKARPGTYSMADVVR